MYVCLFGILINYWQLLYSTFWSLVTFYRYYSSGSAYTTKVFLIGWNFKISWEKRLVTKSQWLQTGFFPDFLNKSINHFLFLSEFHLSRNLVFVSQIGEHKWLYELKSIHSGIRWTFAPNPLTLHALVQVHHHQLRFQSKSYVGLSWYW